jgi:hypothetical protein
MVDAGRASPEDMASNQILADGKKITDAIFDCFPDKILTKHDRNTDEGIFHSEYGGALLLVAASKEPSSELERAEQKTLLIEARKQLEDATQRLKSLSDTEKNQRAKAPLRDQLFFLGEAEDALRTAQRRLENVKQTLRQ